MNRYPTDEELDKIEKWPQDDLPNLIEYVRVRWTYDDYFQENEKEYRMITGGWSGNEDLIMALKENFAFWHLYWYSTTRGGLYVFKKPENEE